MICGELLAARPAPLGPEVIQRDGARDLAQPRLRRAAGGVEAVPEAKGALERRAGQVLRDATVAGEPGEVAVHVVEVLLGSLGERHLACSTPPAGRASQNSRTWFIEARPGSVGPASVQLADLADLVRVRALLLDPRHLEVRREVLQRRVREERAETLAHQSFE